MDILEFQGEYCWLSNFSPCKIILDGVTYKSVEHAYMSAKSENEEWKLFCQTEELPGVIKKKSKNIVLRPDWEKVKVDIMYKCLVQKYNQEPYRTKLIDTGDAYIQEGNRWKDTFWGVDLNTNKGKNTLGLLIMNIRRSL